MTPCLAPDEFVDLLDGTLPPARRAHLETCARCRDTASEVRQAWDAAAAVDVPEPSALFWPSINARVRAAIEGPAGARARTWWRWPVLVPAGLAAAAVLAVLATLPRSTPPPDGVDARVDVSPTAGATAPVEAEPAVAEAGFAPLDDAALALMMDLAGGLPDGAWDTLGIRALPDIDVAAAVLTDDEQRALAALLQAEVSRPKS